ncbi:uncharacterized protein N7459_001313 [Penicillium hispanicum]|uniref:uncharacterized protein n=1 Tax=Penicillium hispanicum TaxID=1080232 RepID=UPI0025412022|nr:uncharacterized protein N7459_001313 [Penicillium hispanicum]KAJ5595105.1 hypothetical protein N7459_001313 [Penicillium hispanicum]
MPPATAGNDRGRLFSGAKFWLSQNVPQRAKFKDMIAEHGGSVVLLEKDADMKLVDHTRKNLPPDTYSYRYVERSIQTGLLEDPAVHRAGPSAPRPMGATQIPKKGTRSDYSLKDDQIVYDWVYPFEQEPGAPISGNKIYQLLERQFPQHTWQSWRSRYTRILRGNPRPGGGDPRPDLVHPGYRRQPHRPLAQLPMAPPQSRTSVVAHPAPNPTEYPKRKRDSTPNPSPSKEYAPSPAKRQAIEAPQPVAPVRGGPRRQGQTAETQTHTHAIQHIYEESTSNNFHPPKTPTKTQPVQAQPRNTPVSTQQRESTQPDPREEMVDPLFFELPFLPSSPEPEGDGAEDGEDDAPDVDSWIDAQVARGRADESIVIAALRCTSMDPELAEAVLDHWHAENGIPEDMPGVWTAEDDQCLEGQDARGIKRVLRKHGEDALNSRWKYFRMAREAGLIQ